MTQNSNKCGAECGERAVLSTKDGDSLPLRHLFLLKKVVDVGASGSDAAIHYQGIPGSNRGCFFFAKNL